MDGWVNFFIQLNSLWNSVIFEGKMHKNSLEPIDLWIGAIIFHLLLFMSVILEMVNFHKFLLKMQFSIDLISFFIFQWNYQLTMCDRIFMAFACLLSWQIEFTHWIFSSVKTVSSICHPFIVTSKIFTKHVIRNIQYGNMFRWKRATKRTP